MNHDAAELDSFLLGTFAALQVEQFEDPRGGYHEALDASGNPTAYQRKRLLVACRQLYVSSHAAIRSRQAGHKDLYHRYEHSSLRGLSYLCEKFRDTEHGGWIFSVSPDGTPLDETKDLYGHAFVIFALSYTYRAFGSSIARDLAIDTWNIIDRTLRDRHHGGFLEGTQRDGSPLDVEGPRRQNPHMHLLEALLIGFEMLNEPSFEPPARELRGLLESLWIDRQTHTLREFFREDWSPDPEHGQIVEPGHHFEWTWILYRFADLFGDESARRLGDRLCQWAELHGQDQAGASFDEVDPTGRVLKDSKRIWPQLEAIKAAAVQASTGNPEARRRLDSRLRTVQTDYLKPTGHWTEQRTADGSILRSDLPGSTGYHIFLALSEAIDAIVDTPES